MPDPLQAPVMVIGIGDELRGDDGAGVAVARLIRPRAATGEIEVRELQGDPAALIDAWRGRAAVVLVDTMRSGAPPGTIRRFDAGEGALPSGALGRGSTSTHAIGVADAIELARALGRLPARAILYAVEGRTFTAGAHLSGELSATLGELSDQVLAEAVRLRASACSREPPRALPGSAV